MAILRVDGLRREIGDFVILDSVSAAIAHGERIGLVGANGAGKTTLLTLIAGREEPDAGRVIRKAGLSVGLLTQEANLDPVFAAAPSVRIGVRSGAAEVEEMERELLALESRGADAVESPQYAALRDRFEQRDGYHLDQRVEETLSGLGLTPDEWDRRPLELSGGEQTRAALARLIVSDPDLLMLDEPTNHLDLGALEWLEDTLTRRQRALLVASHDRAFLDAVVQRVWELRDRRLEPFRGDYTAYLRQRAARDLRLTKDSENAVAAIARERELIQRYRSHRKFSKMHEHERRLEQIKEVDAPKRGPSLRLTGTALLGGGAVRSGDVVVGLRDLVVGFRARRDPEDPTSIATTTPVLTVPRLEASRGERIGIVGPNGAGKTTLLRTIAGELSPLDGLVKLGAAVQPAYLAQLRRVAFPGATVLDALLAVARVDNGPARSYLARFLFRGEDVSKPVSELSGGERSRLELALLGIMPANLLLLDEPTNHLDIPAREALESFLHDSPATLIVVSHDRRLLEGLCDRMWVVEGGGAVAPGQAAAFEGGYREWRAAQANGWTVDSELELQSRRLDGHRPATGAFRGPRPSGTRQLVAVGAAASAGATTSNGSGPRPTAPPRLSRPAPLSKDAYRRQRSGVEEDLTRLGLRKTHLELALGDPAVQANFVELRRVTSELADVDAALAQAEDAWLQLEERAPR